MQTEFWKVGDVWPLQDQSSFQKQSRAVQSRLELGELAAGREASQEAVAGETQKGPPPPPRKRPIQEAVPLEIQKESGIS